MRFYDKIFFSFSSFVTSGIEFTWNAFYKHSYVKQGVCLGLMPGGKGKFLHVMDVSRCHSALKYQIIVGIHPKIHTVPKASWADLVNTF